jgi:hypothetical protein
VFAGEGNVAEPKRAHASDAKPDEPQPLSRIKPEKTRSENRLVRCFTARSLIAEPGRRGDSPYPILNEPRSYILLLQFQIPCFDSYIQYQQIQYLYTYSSNTFDVFHNPALYIFFHFVFHILLSNLAF